MLWSDGRQHPGCAIGVECIVRTAFAVSVITPTILDRIIAYAVGQGLCGRTVRQVNAGDTESLSRS